MKLSKQEEYGLRCLVQIAKANGENITIHEIAEKEMLTSVYAAKLLRILQSGGLIYSTRGRIGGYKLNAPAHKISIGSVLRVLGGCVYHHHFCNAGNKDESSCIHKENCSIRALWNIIGSQLDYLFDSLTLADLLNSEKEMESLCYSFIKSPPEINQSMIVN